MRLRERKQLLALAQYPSLQAAPSSFPDPVLGPFDPIQA